MKDYLNFIFAINSRLGKLTGSEDVKKRFLNDLAAWGLFMLTVRCMRNEKPTPESERACLSFAGIASVGIRAGGPSWLEDQFARLAQSLTNPAPRDRVQDEVKEHVAKELGDDVMKRAMKVAARLAVSNAARNEKDLPGAIKSATQYLNAVHGATEARIPTAHLGDADATACITKVRRHLNDAAAFQYAIGEPTTAVLINNAVKSGAFDDIFQIYEPKFDMAWVPDHEMGSPESKDEGNAERVQSELDNVHDDVESRTGDVTDEEPGRKAQVRAEIEAELARRAVGE